MRKLILTSLAAVVVSLAVLAPGGATDAGAIQHDPILFIHGYKPVPGTWNTMKARFIANGWPSNRLYASYTFPSSGTSNEKIAKTIAEKVSAIRKATGAKKVDIIAHSMGSLSSRYYLKKLGGTAYVDEWVSLGGPNHGTPWAYAPTCILSSPCNQMVPFSGFLIGLNWGDETPGSVRYGTWRSPCDLVVPASSVPLVGAAKNALTWCISHSALTTNSTVYNQVRDFVR